MGAKPTLGQAPKDGEGSVSGGFGDDKRSMVEGAGDALGNIGDWFSSFFATAASLPKLDNAAITAPDLSRFRTSEIAVPGLDGGLAEGAQAGSIAAGSFNAATPFDASAFDGIQASVDANGATMSAAFADGSAAVRDAADGTTAAVQVLGDRLIPYLMSIQAASSAAASARFNANAATPAGGNATGSRR